MYAPSLMWKMIGMFEADKQTVISIIIMVPLPDMIYELSM